MAKRSRFAFMARKSRECVEEALTPAQTDPEIRRMMVRSANNEGLVKV